MPLEQQTIKNNIKNQNKDNFCSNGTGVLYVCPDGQQLGGESQLRACKAENIKSEQEINNKSCRFYIF